MAFSKKNFDKSCVCPCKRSVCKWPVAALAFLSFVFTIVAIFMCLSFQKSRFFNLPGFLYNFSVTLVIWIVVISILSLIAVVLGVASGFITNRCIVIGFGILFLPVWLVFTVSAITVMSFVSSAAKNEDGLKIFCDDIEQNNMFTDNMKEYADDLIKLYDGSDKWMCSNQCPCKPS